MLRFTHCQPKEFGSSPGVRRSFCAVCGSPIAYRSDRRPKIVDLYVKEFTEDELKELLAFWRTPTGQKAMKTLPSIMQQGGAIGQAYAASKQQETLKTKIGAIIAKYRPQKP